MKRILRHLALLVVLGSALVVLEPTLASARIQTIRVGTRNVLVMIPRRRPLHESGYPLLVALHGAGGGRSAISRPGVSFTPAIGS